MRIRENGQDVDEPDTVQRLSVLTITVNHFTSIDYSFTSIDYSFTSIEILKRQRNYIRPQGRGSSLLKPLIHNDFLSNHVLAESRQAPKQHSGLLCT